MKLEAEAAKEKCCSLWYYLGAREWEKARALLADEFEATWPQSKEMKLFAVSFFELNCVGLIKSATEYWADTYDPPEWRQNLVQRN